MRVVILGAAGRDFHDFNVAFRSDPSVEVVAFTQAPGQNLGALDDDGVRHYPPELAGDHYPDGIPIRPEAELEALIDEYDVDRVVFSYSDVSHEHVMHLASRALAAGADFQILGPDSIWLTVDVPVVAVDAVRTGCGKSKATAEVADALADRGETVRIVREPMPYGDLVDHRIQRFASEADLDSVATIEEREEYEAHVAAGRVVFAGVDYDLVLDRAAAEAEVIVWDGGNNELPFVEPDLEVVLADPLRPGDEVGAHPGETNVRRADCVLVTKENSAAPADVARVVEHVRAVNPGADVRHADAVVTVDDPDAVEGARVLAVEDGPSITHGDRPRGAAAVAADEYGAAERVDPDPAAVGSIADALAAHPHLDRVLPAMGYSGEQVRDLERTVAAVDCDLVLAGTPHDLATQIDVDVPIVDVDYELELRAGDFAGLVDAYADVIGIE